MVCRVDSNSLERYQYIVLRLRGHLQHPSAKPLDVISSSYAICHAVVAHNGNASNRRDCGTHFEVLVDMRQWIPAQAHGLAQQPRNADRSVPTRNQREHMLNAESSVDHASVALRNSLWQWPFYKDQQCTPRSLKPKDQKLVLAISAT